MSLGADPSAEAERRTEDNGLGGFCFEGASAATLCDGVVDESGLSGEIGDSTVGAGDVLVCATSGCSFRALDRQNRRARPSSIAKTMQAAAASAVVHRQEVRKPALAPGTKAPAFDRSSAGTGAG